MRTNGCPRFPRIGEISGLAQRLRRRFPLVLLDEAQDTNGAQLALLDRLFGEGVAYQRLGDQNQTLYEDEELTPDDYWKAGEDVIPLNHTRRFGADIAAFSSRLTARAAQQIESRIEQPSRRVLILFGDLTIHDVLRIYAEEVRAHWGDDLAPELDIRAVASRHNPTRGTTGGYGRPITKRTVWTTLRDINPALPLAVQRLIRDQVICGDAPWSADAWNAFQDALAAALGIEEGLTQGSTEFLEFIPYREDDEAEPGGQQSRTIFDYNDVPIRLGSIHSVKGKTGLPRPP